MESPADTLPGRNGVRTDAGVILSCSPEGNDGKFEGEKMNRNLSALKPYPEARRSRPTTIKGLTIERPKSWDRRPSAVP